MTSESLTIQQAVAKKQRPARYGNWDWTWICASVVGAVQCERSTIGPARKFSRQQLIGWVKHRTAQGDVVHAVYECCGFGYTLHQELVAAGAHCMVTHQSD